MMTARVDHKEHDWYFSTDLQASPADLSPTEGITWMACTPGYAVLDSGCTLRCVGDESLNGYMRRCTAETGAKPASFSQDVMFEGIRKKPVQSTEGIDCPVSFFRRSCASASLPC